MRNPTSTLLAALLTLLLVNGCDSTTRPGLLDLGEACSASDACSSGYCNGDICSECEDDADCDAGESCMDDTAGLGYFVCDDGLANLGDACSAGVDCTSGYCNANLCSECEADADCASAETCVDDTAGVGYFVCDDGLADLGEACSAGADCSSGFCNADLCSECEADADCPGAATCEDDTAGVGWFVCQAGSGALGDACTSGADCASGFCNGGVCSECEADADCPTGAVCFDDTAGVGYFACQAQQTGALGDLCSQGSDCDSGFCNTGVCSECAADADCGTGEACQDDTAGVGYFVCESTQGGLGDACTDAADCDSGFCRNEACSLCAQNSDCLVQQDCSFDGGLGYSQCVGTGDLGDSCEEAGQCVSTYCSGGACSECTVDGDCSGDGTCVDDTAGVGYFVCSGGLGDNCTDGADCNSGFCNNNRCSECELNGDCGVQQDCVFSGADGYASCVGTGNLGDSCDTADQCASEFCNSGVCSQCEIDADCGVDGVCADEPNNQGFYVCAHDLGEACQTAAQCISGFCFDQPSVCSECADDADCAIMQACAFTPALGYAACVGTGDLGDSCADAGQCASGFCVADLCSACESDADCDVGVCSQDPGGAGFMVCLGGLGDPCVDGVDCLSGFCFNRFAQSDVCSECAVDGDCPDGTCEYSDGPDYATCRGAGALGDDCTTGADCDSGFCAGDVCSDCELDTDCGSGGSCLDDTSASGYWVCLSGLGELCETGADCGSGFCYEIFTGFLLCSECEVDGDCANQQVCQIEMGDPWATCAGTAGLGDDCQADAECESGFCNTNLCSECLADGDCGDGGACIDDPDGTGYFVCASPLGANCNDPADCVSGYCFNAPGPGPWICSLCTNDGDCNGGTCDWDQQLDYATCN